ncbi:MAG: serine protease [Nitrospira sp.]|nr:serine protease [Nitrospira sp.]MDH4243529.1 serine protease [Nitrospira sp.]MDH4355588.1 serine protease [Nitrospira sp.]MDH5318080.1 serine protease [Nitrospira sp.]
MMAQLFFYALLVQLTMLLPSALVLAQDLTSATSTSASDEGYANGLRQVPDASLLRRLSPVFQNLEKDLILKSTRGEKEQRLFRECAPAVVLVLTKDSLGSGVIIDKSGHVITNHHVVGPNSTVAVVFKPRNGEDLTKDLARRATVEKVDEIADLALLKIDTPPQALSSLPLGNAGILEVGTDVHSIGHPEGEIWTYTRGTISAIRKNYETTIEGKVFRANVIQHQTPTNPGNSGGPLLSDSCAVVGINTFVKGREGLNFAVSVDTVRRFLDAPKSNLAPAPVQPQPNCPKNEQYDLVRFGWGMIAGCYVEKSGAPPNWWISRPNPNDEPYSAVDLDHNGWLETAMIKNEDGGYLWAFDNDCDGFVDAVGYQSEGSADIQSYSQPRQRISLREVVSQIDYALKAKAIPHPTLRVCQ